MCVSRSRYVLRNDLIRSVGYKSAKQAFYGVPLDGGVHADDGGWGGCRENRRTFVVVREKLNLEIGEQKVSI